MNFFEHQVKARKQTRRLVLLFVLAIFAIIVAIDVVLLLLVLTNESPESLRSPLQRHSGLLVAASAVTFAIIILASLYKTAGLRSGGGSVARALGGTFVSPDTRQPRLRRLRNVVEEIAIASGTAVPEIYLLEQESGINAFAAGWSPADAAVVVTRGALEKLDRDELQGVIAHEFSHILNGDMRLNIRLMGLLFGILVIAVIGRKVFNATSRSRRSSRKGAAAVVAFALMVMLIGYVGLFFGRLIKASVSRSREFLADASAVQFTRQTTGIAGALKKIAGIDVGSRLASTGGEEVAHMLFGDGVGYSALFATHPPLRERIRRIDPHFKFEQLNKQRQQWNEPGYLADDPAADTPVTSPFSHNTGNFSAQAIISQIAHPSEDAYRYAEIVRAAIPPTLQEAATNVDQAGPLLFALLLDRKAEIRQCQLAAITRSFGQTQSEHADRLFVQLTDLPAEQRLPLATLAVPCLRHLPREHLGRFPLTVNELIQADGAVSMSELCLGVLLLTHVVDILYPARATVIGKQRLNHSRSQALTLLAMLAQQGHADALRARQAFMVGAAHLFPQSAEPYQPPLAAVLVSVLRTLDQLDAAGKQLLIEAMVKTLTHDQQVAVGEAELLRTVCAALHCPLPLVLRES